MKKTIWKVMITLLICMAAVGGKWSGCKVQAETYGDFEYTVSGDEVEITAYTGKNETVEIPANINGKKVTSIGMWAFSRCDGLTSITIPAGVERIGYGAFDSCTNLTSIDIPEGVISIEAGAFWGCSNLENIHMPDSLTSIGDSAFYGCSKLKSVNIPANVTNIEGMVFSCCGNLDDIEVDINNEIYDSRNNCNAIIETKTNTLVSGCKNTTIPDNVQNIGYQAFYDCSNLEHIDIPKSVKNIGEEAFAKCDDLKSINLSENLEEIDEQAFNGCSNLQSIDIPDTVTYIGAFAFWECSSLEQVILSKNLSIIGSSAFNGCSNLRNITIPEKVTEIRFLAFCACSKLESITIPENVTFIDVAAFMGCSNLNNLKVSEKNKNYDSRGNCNAIIETETDTLLTGCKNTTIPDDVTSIADSAFDGCDTLTDIVIPENVKNIGSYAFRDCSSLKSIYIPDSVISIGADVFSGCNQELVIYVPVNSYAAQWAKEEGLLVQYIEEKIPETSDEASDVPSSNPTISETLPEQGGTPPLPETPSEQGEVKPLPETSNTTLKKPADKGKMLVASEQKCKVKVLSNSTETATVEYVKNLNNSAMKITVPETVVVDSIIYKVVSVADKAFKGNKKLTSVSIGKNVTSIGKEAFMNCMNLKSVNIKSTQLNKIGANAFNGDKKLIKITLKTTKFTSNSIGKNILKGTSKKLVIRVPRKNLNKYKKYFKNKGNKFVKIKK